MAYADDIALIDSSAEVLQSMVDLCVRYSYQWHNSFNTSKSAVIMRGESPPFRGVYRSSHSWLLGSEVMNEVYVFRYHYFGIWFRLASYLQFDLLSKEYFLRYPIQVVH